jgi:hypothetical protein
MKTYTITVIRVAGKCPSTGQFMDEASETLSIDADNEDQAFRLSQVKSKLSFRGQDRRTLVNGVEYFDPKH